MSLMKEVTLADGFTAYKQNWDRVVLRDDSGSMGHVVVDHKEQPLLYHFINDLIEAASE